MPKERLPRREVPFEKARPNTIVPDTKTPALTEAEQKRRQAEAAQQQ